MKKALRIVFAVILIAIIALYLFLSSETWGINKTVGWAWDFTNFMFWIGLFVSLIVFSAILILIFFLLKYILKKTNTK